MTLNDYQKAAERTSAPTVARKWMEVLKMAEHIMTDCTRTMDFFAAWKRLCKEQHGACRGCPLSGDATGSIFTCQRFAFEQPAEAVRIVQAWADAHPAPTWEDKLRELLPKAGLETLRALCPGDFFGKAAQLEDNGTCLAQSCTACWQREYAEGE